MYPFSPRYVWSRPTKGEEEEEANFILAQDECHLNKYQSDLYEWKHYSITMSAQKQNPNYHVIQQSIFIAKSKMLRLHNTRDRAKKTAKR